MLSSEKTLNNNIKIVEKTETFRNFNQINKLFDNYDVFDLHVDKVGYVLVLRSLNKEYETVELLLQGDFEDNSLNGKAITFSNKSDIKNSEIANNDTFDVKFEIDNDVLKSMYINGIKMEAYFNTDVFKPLEKIDFVNTDFTSIEILDKDNFKKEINAIKSLNQINNASYITVRNNFLYYHYDIKDTNCDYELNIGNNYSHSIKSNVQIYISNISKIKGYATLNFNEFTEVYNFKYISKFLSKLNLKSKDINDMFVDFKQFNPMIINIDYGFDLTVRYYLANRLE